jgi:hypothetical protein
VTAAVADDVADTFTAALEKDAGREPGRDVPSPPPPARDPEAPHGRGPDGAALAPYGLKGDGTPRVKPGGPGRPKVTAAGAPPHQAAPPAAITPTAGGEDYSEDLLDLATSVWIGASSLKGGKLGPLKLPDLRAYALVWHQQTPSLVATWNKAAQQSPAVRGYVRKLSGEGSWSWIIGVAVSGAGLAAGLSAVRGLPPEKRGELAAVNDAKAREFITAQMEALGLEPPEEEAA